MFLRAQRPRRGARRKPAVNWCAQPHCTSVGRPTIASVRTPGRRRTQPSRSFFFLPQEKNLRQKLAARKKEQVSANGLLTQLSRITKKKFAKTRRNLKKFAKHATKTRNTCTNKRSMSWLASLAPQAIIFWALQHWRSNNRSSNPTHPNSPCQVALTRRRPVSPRRVPNLKAVSDCQQTRQSARRAILMHTCQLQYLRA